MTKEALTLALEALEGVAQWTQQRTQTHPWDAWQRVEPAIAAIKEALAAPQGEPYGLPFVPWSKEAEMRESWTQHPSPAPPHECQTEAEKIAYAAGWWKALEVNHPAQELWIADEILALIERHVRGNHD